MNLGQLYRTLLYISLNHLPVTVNGEPISDVFSWRGDYEQLTIGPDRRGRPDASDMSKTRLTAVLDNLLSGHKLPGYKGGEYSFTASTPVWCDPYGEVEYQRLVGVRINDGDIELVSVRETFWP